MNNKKILVVRLILAALLIISYVVVAATKHDSNPVVLGFVVAIAVVLFIPIPGSKPKGEKKAAADKQR